MERVPSGPERAPATSPPRLLARTDKSEADVRAGGRTVARLAEKGRRRIGRETKADDERQMAFPSHQTGTNKEGGARVNNGVTKELLLSLSGRLAPSGRQ